jgi:hypothetical protein
MPDMTMLIPLYCGLYQDDAFWPRSGSKHQMGECGRKVGRGKRDKWVQQWNKGQLELGNVTWRPEEGHLAPEVTIANEITRDYVWDKLYPPISVTCSKWCIRKAPFVLGAQPLDMSLLSRCWACLINLLPENFGARLSVWALLQHACSMVDYGKFQSPVIKMLWVLSFLESKVIAKWLQRDWLRA